MRNVKKVITQPMTDFHHKVGTRYLQLVLEFPLRPLRSEEDLDSAITMIDKLIDQPTLTCGEQDYLEVLGSLVEAYEAEHITIPQVAERELVHFLIEQKGTTQTAVAKETKIAASTISEVLAGKRKLTKNQIDKLAKYFHINPAVFFRGD